MKEIHELFNKYAKDVYRFALFLCGDEMEAEDITSETFSRLLTGKITIKSGTVKGYLLTIARNLHIDTTRRKKHYTKTSDEFADPAQNLENAYSYKTELDAVKTYLQTFPEVDRTALFLRAEGLSYDEIAKSLDISLSSAKVKIHRVRKNLLEWRMKREKIKNKEAK